VDRHNGGVTTGQELLDELRRQRRGGDPRITPEGREILTRIVIGDLADEFADSLAEISDSDPLLGGGADEHDG
jgi:hypothetical protein